MRPADTARTHFSDNLAIKLTSNKKKEYDDCSRL